MCTAATYLTNHFYFGRTLDLHFSYGEEVVITPRNFPFSFYGAGERKRHYAMIGTAFVPDGFPLYYDAVNEKGLCMAGLNFVGNARYFPDRADRCNVAQYELIPFLLGDCASVAEAKKALKTVNVTARPYSSDLHAAELHWLIADKKEAFVLECVEEGMKIYENPVGVLANNPPFPMQTFRLNDYMRLSPKQPRNAFCKKLGLKPYSLGMGGIGLPGDLSSPSRFVRTAFARLNSVSGTSEEESVSQFFHVLGAVEQPRGCNEAEDGYEYTVYTSCCNADTGVYYYSTYENRCLTAVDLRRADLQGAALFRYPHVRRQNVILQNG